MLDLNAVRSILAAHKTALIAKYSADGVSIGRSDVNPNSYAIVIYVRSLPNDPPEMLQGVPLQFVVAGPFKAL